MFASKDTLFTRPSGYTIARSVRLRSSASAYLNRTFSTPTSSTKWTWSGWLKFGYASSYYTIFDGGSPDTRFGRDPSTNQLYVNNDTTNYIITTPVYRDYSAWYHAVLAFDSSQGTASNRLRLYINGVEVTAFATDNRSSISGAIGINTATAHGIGRQPSGGSAYYDGYMTEINFVDGQQLTPSSFGTTNSLGIWQPIRYGGSYGTNGFYLPFTNTTSTTTLGYDFSPNGNNWTPNNISLTAGSTYDSMKDVPTLTDTDTANYCVINPLQNGGLTITNGNLTWAGSGSSVKCATGSIAMTSGKWYFEALITGSSGGNWYSGVCNLSPTLTSAPSATATGWGLVTGGGGTVLYKSNNNNLTSLSSSSVTGSVVSFAIDVDAGKIWFAQNGSWLEGSPSAGTGASYTNLTGTQIPYVAGYDSNDQGSINFGQRPFAYTPPTGFKALNTFNLPTPTIGATASTQANKYFDVTLYTGNGSTQTITNSGSMQPDFVWMKRRDGADSHALYDSVRGVYLSLFSNATNAETNEPTTLTSFNSNGWSIGSEIRTNGSGRTYVGWQWRASNTTAVTNTAGSITSTVSANTTAGFSIVTYTGTGANATVGHGLGVAPSFIVAKARGSQVVTSDWACYHVSLGATNRIWLNLTNATAASSTYWNNTAPTSSVFSLGTEGTVNSNGNTNVAYCWSAVKGFSAFGSYTGNGSTDGPFVYTGFRPRFVLFKSSSAVQPWNIFDSSRDTYNVETQYLQPNSSGAEGTFAVLDFTSNGFKFRTTDGAANGSGSTYIYAAFAENPFKNALAR